MPRPQSTGSWGASRSAGPSCRDRKVPLSPTQGGAGAPGPWQGNGQGHPSLVVIEPHGAWSLCSPAVSPARGGTRHGTRQVTGAGRRGTVPSWAPILDGHLPTRPEPGGRGPGKATFPFPCKTWAWPAPSTPCFVAGVADSPGCSRRSVPGRGGWGGRWVGAGLPGTVLGLSHGRKPQPAL